MSALSTDAIHAALWGDAPTLDPDAWEAGADPGDPEREGGPREESLAGLRLLSLDAYATRFPEPEWLAEPYIARARNVFAAPSGMGKTELLADLVARITRDGKRVLYVNTDDDPTLASRFDGRDYVAANLVFVDTELRGDALAAALVEAVGALASAGRAPDLVVVDTLSAAWRVENEAGYSATNAAALAFWKIFARHGVAVLLTHHMVKRTDGSFDDVRSAGVTDHADHVVTYTGDPAKTRRRVRTFKRLAPGRDFWIDFNPTTKTFRDVEEYYEAPVVEGDRERVLRAVRDMVRDREPIKNRTALVMTLNGGSKAGRRAKELFAAVNALLADGALIDVNGRIELPPDDDPEAAREATFLH
jgi:hypothetical protein